MKKLLVVLAILFVVSIVSYGQDPVKEDWEVVPGIISGGYSEETGAYIYELSNTFTCPSLVADYGWYYVQYLQGIAGNVGYGDFQHHGGGSLISSDNQGEITKADDGTWAVMYTHTYVRIFRKRIPRGIRLNLQVYMVLHTFTKKNMYHSWKLDLRVKIMLLVSDKCLLLALK